MPRGFSRSIAAFAWLIVACSSPSDDHHEKPAVRPATPVVVAAAADLTIAFAKIGEAFEKQSGAKVTFSFGATGLLTKQIREGAPFDVFAAASASFVDELIAHGDCEANTRAPYGQGHVVVWSKPTVAKPPATLEGLSDPRFERIALANPAHAPYGKAAKEALQKAGLWSALEPRIVYGENVKQAMQFADSGNAEAALVALSLVIDRPKSEYLPVDTALYAPIDQVLAVCKHGKNAPGGEAFVRFVNGAEGRAILRRHGFVLPSETLAERP